MDYLQIAKEILKRIASRNSTKPTSAKSVLSAERNTETRFTSETDLYRPIGARNYWKNHVPANMRPQWVKEVYALKDEEVPPLSKA